MKLEPLDDLPERPYESLPATLGPDYEPSNYGTVKPRLDMQSDEQRLTKGDAVRLNRLGMAAFLRDLEEWAFVKRAQGYSIDSAPEEGPGTMVWRARR